MEKLEFLKHRQMKRTFILILVILFCYSLFAQTDNDNITKPKNIKVGNIKVTLKFNGDIAPEEMRYLLINEACQKACKQAGLHENIQSYSVLHTVSGSGDRFLTDKQVFQNLSIIESEGLVQYDKPVFTPEKFTEGQDCSVELINASVDMYPPYNMEITRIDGLKNIYKDGEQVSFKFKMNADSYLRVVAIEANRGKGYIKRLYPNPEALDKFTGDNVTVKNDSLFRADVYYNFPAILNGPELTADLETGKEEEILYLACIAVSNRTPILGDDIDYETFFDWYFKKLKHTERSKINIIPITILKK